MNQQHIHIELLLTGNEVLAGDTIDTNSALFGQGLAELGLKITRKLTVGDDLELLVDSLALQSKASDILIVNGGLGPTEDDLTALALSKAMGVPLVEYPEVLAFLKEWCQRRNIPLNAPNRKQAMLPQGLEIISNPEGSAAGFAAKLNDCLVICTPGVPSELRPMFGDSVLPMIKEALPAGYQKRTTLRWPCFGLGESTLQRLLTEQAPERPAGIELGFRVSRPLVEVKLTYAEPLGKEEQEFVDAAAKVLGAHLLADKPTTLAPLVVQLLQEQGKFITFAESCTGGSLAAQLTTVPGASQVFAQGIVSYANEVKTNLLGVSAEMLAEHGAVSEQVTLAMARGALASSGADCAIAVSGVAGPSGGSAQKPVGLVCIAWGSAADLRVETLYFPGDRAFFQEMVSAASLDLIRRFLLDCKEEPRYFIERRYRPDQET